MTDTDTPITNAMLRRYDGLPPLEAVVRAWAQSGVHPGWHEKAAMDVRDTMPLLGRALDRLAVQHLTWTDLGWVPPEDAS